MPAGGDRLSRSPNLKRHVEEEVSKVHHGQHHHHHHHNLSDAVATGKKIPRLAEGERAIALATEISERNKDLHLPGILKFVAEIFIDKYILKLTL